MAAKTKPATGDFAKTISEAYAAEGATIDLGRGILDGTLHPDAVVQAPLATMNRHGLITGATGTGKTRTLQGLAEQLSDAGVPCVVADIKGDLTGLSAPGDPEGPAAKRAKQFGIDFEPHAFPVQYLSLGGIGPGIPVRATLSDFGPRLLAKVLRCNQTQEQSLELVFHYADEKGLPLLDLSDLRALLTFLDSDEGAAELKGIGGLASSTVGVLLRSLTGLEADGGTELFGEPQLEISDLITTTDGKGVISCLELSAIFEKPDIFSTAMMWLVAELFEQLPEEGDLPKPKLVFFFDEAHLLFDGATDAFLDSVEQTVRLIRSKGVGVFFITQTPKDVPAPVLAQLGNRIQHALRAFTPEDAKALKATVSTFPKSDFYDLEEMIPALGTGEAAVTILSEKGIPTPVVHTSIHPPSAAMDAVGGVEEAAKKSALFAKYGQRVDNQSAREILAARVDAAAAGEPAAQADPPKPTERQREAAKAKGSGVGAYLRSREGRALVNTVVRGAFGILRKRL